MTSKQWWAIGSISALLLVILLALGVIGGGDKTEPGHTANQQHALPPGSKTLTLHRQNADGSQLWQGVVQARSAARLAPKISARVIEVSVHAGDRVKKGAVIAKLDDRDLRAAYQAAQSAVAAAQAQAGQAETEAKRMSDLYTKQAATRQSYEVAQAHAKSARALTSQASHAAQQAQVTLSDGVLLAPFDAIVSERLKEPGDMANPGEAVVTLYQPDALRLEVALPSRCLSYVQRGAALPVRLSAEGEALNASVDEIVPQIDRATDTQIVKLRLPATDSAQPGQTGWLGLACQAEHSSLLIPQTAVMQFGQLQAVKVVENGQVSVRHVRLGKTFGEQIEVLSGLREGETIVEIAEVSP